MSLLQAGRLCLETMLWTGDTVPGIDHAATGRPDVPSYEALPATPMPGPALCNESRP